MSDPAPSLYSVINPNSPWRWVPVFGLFVLTADLLVSEILWPDSLALFFLIAAPVLVLVIISPYKVGSSEAAHIAIREARATGGVRVNSHPWLAWTMLVVGSALFCLFIIKVYFTDYVPKAERTTWQQMLWWSPVVGPVSVLLLSFGLSRPWDLKVVDRGSRPIVGAHPVTLFIARQAGLLVGRTRRLVRV